MDPHASKCTSSKGAQKGVDCLPNDKGVSLASLHQLRCDIMTIKLPKTQIEIKYDKRVVEI